VRHGMREAGAASGVCSAMADLLSDARSRNWEKLWCIVEQGKDQIAIGFAPRRIDRSLIGVHQPGFRETMGASLSTGVMRVGDPELAIADTQCGFKLFRGRTWRRRYSLPAVAGAVRIRRPRCSIFAVRRGYSIAEVPVPLEPTSTEARSSMLTGVHALR